MKECDLKDSAIVWKLARRLYELNRHVAKINNKGLCLISTDDKRDIIAWDNIDREYSYEVMEDYLFVARELLDGLTGTTQMKRIKDTKNPFEMTKEEILEQYPQYVGAKNIREESVSLLTLQVLAYLETKQNGKNQSRRHQ